MRRRAIVMTTTAVAVAVLILGIPGMMFAVSLAWQQSHTELTDRATAVATIVDRFASEEIYIGETLLTRLAEGGNPERAYIEVDYPDGFKIASLTEQAENVISENVVSASGALVTVSTPRGDVITRLGIMVAGALGLILTAFVVGVMVARALKKSTSSPRKSYEARTGWRGALRRSASSPPTPPTSSERHSRRCRCASRKSST